MLVWLTLPFYDFCGFRSVAVNSVFINCSFFYIYLYSALLWIFSSLKRSKWHVLVRMQTWVRLEWRCLSDHTVVPAIHFYPQMECAILLLIPSRSASLHFGRYSFPVPQRLGGWVGLCGIGLPAEDGHPSQYQPTDSARPEIKLMITESQVSA